MILHILLLASAFAAIVLYEVPEIIRNRDKKELIVFAALVAIGFLTSLLQLNAEIPQKLRALFHR
ncbi:MAG: hypothetical protein IMF26_02585 [Candidatus Fermentithermobacillus carboniphilus]|uniref:Stage III sporulation protein AC n=1 Tax=Candidatus Fermentithermobacillus carboniphilus TaxID=3085328 RepID=A0AAT9LD23_9FIRM|nr:MAG: hypothetical protein IMF26_02585 [Candidatus Fermentithermobacillus carboniphilus]